MHVSQGTFLTYSTCTCFSPPESREKNIRITIRAARNSPSELVQSALHVSMETKNEGRASNGGLKSALVKKEPHGKSSCVRACVRVFVFFFVCVYSFARCLLQKRPHGKSSCVLTCVHTHTHTTHSHLQDIACADEWQQRHMYIRACIYVHTHTHTHIYIYVHVYIHTYTHIHTYIQSFGRHLQFC